MRPRFRSYGESSTATLSPGRMRMKFLRIFPETCARTWCLFSNSTLNMALGSGSTTVAITSIASSLLIDSLSQLLLRQNQRAVSGHCHTVLKVSAGTAVSRYRRPLVVQDLSFWPARIHHRLDCEHHALAQPCIGSARLEIRHLRLFVQLSSYAVSYKLAHHTKAVGFDIFLHRSTDVTDAVADLHLLDRLVQRLLGNFQQFLPLGRN